MLYEVITSNSFIAVPKAIDTYGGVLYDSPVFYGGCSSVGRAQDCGSCCRGFDSHHPPHLILTARLETTRGHLFHDAGLSEQTGCIRFFRITSYNVCYTKLLRLKPVLLGSVELSGMPTALLVHEQSLYVADSLQGLWHLSADLKFIASPDHYASYNFV